MTSLPSDQEIRTALHRSVTERTASRDDVELWLDSAERAGEFSVEARALEELDGWAVDAHTHDISHVSKRFFSVRGADVSIVVDDEETRWRQPIIVQPDIGILGLIATPIDGVLHFLVQAKMEPGNRHLVQVSPTVQATASNFERIHRGSAIPFVDYFQHADAPGYVTTLIDQLQTEQATRYLRKRNRNAIAVASRANLPEIDPRFRWLTLADLVALAEGDDLLHMDTRSILGSIPLTAEPPESGPGLTSTVEWLRSVAQRVRVSTREIALCDVDGWSLFGGRVASSPPCPFAVIGVRVSASHREVAAWDQPLVQNDDGMQATLIVQRRDDALHALVVAATGPGVRDDVELGPSIVRWAAGEREVALDPRSGELVDAAAGGHVWFDNSLPEEGGRFFHSSMRHRIIEIAEDVQVPEQAARRWLDLGQLRQLGRETSLLNMELRSLLACLPVQLRTAG